MKPARKSLVEAVVIWDRGLPEGRGGFSTLAPAVAGDEEILNVITTQLTSKARAEIGGLRKRKREIMVKRNMVRWSCDTMQSVDACSSF